MGIWVVYFLDILIKVSLMIKKNYFKIRETQNFVIKISSEYTTEMDNKIY